MGARKKFRSKWEKKEISRKPGSGGEASEDYGNDEGKWNSRGQLGRGRRRKGS